MLHLEASVPSNSPGISHLSRASAAHSLMARTAVFTLANCNLLYHPHSKTGFTSLAFAESQLHPQSFISSSSQYYHFLRTPHITIALDVGEHPRVLTPHPPPAPDVLGDSQEVRFVCGCGYSIAHSAGDIQVHSRHKICSHLRGFSTTWPRTFTIIAAQTPAVVQSLHHLQLPRLHVPTTQFRKRAPDQIC